MIHGWDLAKATNQPAAYDGPGLEEVPHDAPLLDRILGVTGRDPGWEPPA